MSDEKTTGKSSSGCCGPNFRFPNGMPEEMSRMMEKFCGEGGSFDCGEMMKTMREMFTPSDEEKESK